jgi:hypothetical protein
MNKIALSLLSVIILASAFGCAASNQAVEVASAPIEPPGTITVSFTEKERAEVSHDVPATSAKRHERFVCQWVIAQTGDAFDTKAEALRHGKKLGIPRISVMETCKSDWRLVATRW